jgi:hypothetical protein
MKQEILRQVGAQLPEELQLLNQLVQVESRCPPQGSPQRLIPASTMRRRAASI